MKRATSFSTGIVLAFTAVVAFAAPPKSAADAPTVASFTPLHLHAKEIHWGLSHQEVTDLYDLAGGLFDREYAPLIARLQPGVEMQQLEADREGRKVNFQAQLFCVCRFAERL